MTATRVMHHVPYQRAVTIDLAKVSLNGDLGLPPHPSGIVLFAHGSGSSRLSPRNRFVAERLRASGMGTLLMDLLTESEERIDQRTSQLRFNIRLLAKRLAGATAWALREPDLRELNIGYFGASTGAAAALAAAAQLPGKVAAVVSRGGRPRSGWKCPGFRRCTNTADRRWPRWTSHRSERRGLGKTRMQREETFHHSRSHTSVRRTGNPGRGGEGCGRVVLSPFCFE